MSKPSDGTHCRDCGKRMSFLELRYVVGRGFFLCLDCIPESKPKPRWRVVPPHFRQCSACGCGIAANKERTVRIDPTRPHVDDVVLCTRCVEWQDRASTYTTTTGTNAPAEVDDQCVKCSRDITKGEWRHVLYQRPGDTRPREVSCSECAGLSCPTDTCGICEADCGDDEKCGTIRNGDRAVHVCGKCFDVWEYIRRMAEEGTGHIGGSADPPVTYANEPPPQRPQEVSTREKRIGKLADDAIIGSGEK